MMILYCDFMKKKGKDYRQMVINMPNMCLITSLNHNELHFYHLYLSGFFRVNYDLPNWSLLTKEIQRGSSSIFSPITQAQLMDDAFALARSGLLSYEIPLDMMRTVKDNSSYITWVTALNNVKYFKNVLIHEKHSMIEVRI